MNRDKTPRKCPCHEVALKSEEVKRVPHRIPYHYLVRTPGNTTPIWDLIWNNRNRYFIRTYVYMIHNIYVPGQTFERKNAETKCTHSPTNTPTLYILYGIQLTDKNAETKCTYSPIKTPTLYSIRRHTVS